MGLQKIVLLLTSQLFISCLAEEVSVHNEIVQKLAYMGKWTINNGGVEMYVKKATREPVPVGWKYTIITDVIVYGSYGPELRIILMLIKFCMVSKECIVVGVYDVTAGDIWLSNPDPLNPVPCKELKR